MSVRIEMDRKKKKKKKEEKTIEEVKEPFNKKKKKDPNVLNRGDMAYRMRYDDDGIVWHSYVDPDRPDSPIAEFPEIPAYDEKPWIFENVRKGKPEEDPDLRKLFTKGCDVYGQSGNIYRGENPDKEEDDLDDSIQMPKMPGLFDSRIGKQDGWDDD